MLQRFYRLDRAAGIALHIAPDGSLLIDVCVLSLKGDLVAIEEKFTGLKSTDELQAKLADGIAAGVNISGKGVLTKRLTSADEINPANFNKVMPNADMKDFCVQQAISGESNFVSLLRLTEAEKWFGLLAEINIQALALSLAAFPVLNIAGETNVYGEQLVFNGHVITRNEQLEWLTYEYKPGAHNEFKLKLQQENMTEELLVPYAAAFQLLLADRLEVIHAGAPLFDQARAAAMEKRKLKANAAALIFGFFILLLLNLIVSSNLTSSNDRLSVQLGSFQQQNQVAKVSNDQVRDKQELLKNLGWDGGVRKALLIDQIAAILPPDISWTEAAVNPLKHVEGSQHGPPVFNQHTIQIKGLSEKVLSVNEWIARIRTKPWVQSAALENYSFDPERNTGIFTLNVVYK